MTTWTEAPRARGILTSRRLRRAARFAAALAVLVAVVARVGAGPFVRGLLSIDARAIGAALALTAIATAAAAWRWRVIAGRLGVGLRWSTAVGMYYRSQFLNTVLPGGVLGDIERAVAQGRSTGSVPQAARSVAIERTMGQLVQLVLSLVVLAFFGLEFEGQLLVALGIGVAVLALAGLAATAMSSRVRAVLKRELGELVAGVGSPGALVQVVAASIVVVGCHVATFAIAASAVGARLPAQQLVAVALVVLLGASIPLNIGGWGPREGVAGWAFAIAGFGAGVGVAASTLFGVLAMISVAPGLVLVAASVVRRRRKAASSDPLVLAGSPRKAGS